MFVKFWIVVFEKMVKDVSIDSECNRFSGPIADENSAMKLAHKFHYFRRRMGEQKKTSYI
jgi:hypothetical protein